jgi:hypothetical protein
VFCKFIKLDVVFWRNIEISAVNRRHMLFWMIVEPSVGSFKIFVPFTWNEYYMKFVIVVVVFQGLDLLASSISEFYFLKFINLFRQLVVLFGWGIGPPQGLYLHKTTQNRKTRTYFHASSRIRIHDPSVRAAEESTCLRPLGHWDQRVL